MIRILSVCLLFLSLPVSAQLYKGVDEEGNTVYTDTPFEQAKKLQLPGISVVAPTRIARPASAASDDKADVAKGDAKKTVYRQLSIITPQNKQTFWNNDKLVVSVKVTPALDASAGDRISIKLDGQTVIKASTRLQQTITILDRGEHRIQAAVRNRQGKIIKLSQTVTVHIKRAFLKKKAK